MNKKVYFITGGGTGGHIYPAIAVADALLEDDSTEKIYYVGNPNNLEASIVKDKNYVFLPVISSGMPRKLSFSLFTWGLKMVFAWLKCCFYIIKYKPNVVFGTGGYVSAPALLAAVTTKIPFVMHDCDANPGLVTRKLAPYAKSISIAFDAASNKLNNPHCHTNGNPIRKIFSTLTKQEAKKNLGLAESPVICIMGGSQGAKSINSAAIEILKTLSKEHNFQIIFQTGKKNYEDVISKLETIYPDYINDKNIIVKPYFENMAEILKASEIAVSRAGSLSISELCASSVAAIYIPYPYAAADHQRKNAHYMQEQNAGLYLEDETLSPKILLDAIIEISSPEKLEQIKTNAQRLAKFDGVKNIIAQIKEAQKS